MVWAEAGKPSLLLDASLPSMCPVPLPYAQPRGRTAQRGSAAVHAKKTRPTMFSLFRAHDHAQDPTDDATYSFEENAARMGDGKLSVPLPRNVLNGAGRNAVPERSERR